MIARLLRPAVLGSLLLVPFLPGVPDGLPARDRLRTAAAPPTLGLSTDRELGLFPGARYNAPRGGHGAYRGPSFRYRVPSRWMSSYWAPWAAIPQSIKSKVYRRAVYASPRLGLHHPYPHRNDIGLDLPSEPDEPLLPAWPTPLSDTVSAPLAEAFILMKQGLYARAGRVLAAELKDPPVPLEVHVVIAEILVATGNYSAAARVFRYGLEDAASLDALREINVASHFPDEAAFRAKFDALERATEAGGRAAEQVLLLAGLRLLWGDATAMKDLEVLQVSGLPVATAAKRLYLHFLDALFPEEPTE